MAKTYLKKSVKLIVVLLASLLVNIPIRTYRSGPDSFQLLSLAIILPFIVLVCLEFARHTGRCKQFLENRSFDGMLIRMFLCSLPTFVNNVLGSIWPNIYTDGLQFGMLIGLVTDTRFATLDRPQSPEPTYWKLNSALFGLAYGTLIFLALGRTATALVEGISSAVFYWGGIWLGLLLGNSVKNWIVALKPTFELLKKLGTTLIGFAAGYLTLIVLFATFYAALWRLSGAQSFGGLPATPNFDVFLYFSLVTATTIGYGDITPQTPFARLLAGTESLASLAWTLVVFAALSTRFANEIKSETAGRKED